MSTCLRWNPEGTLNSVSSKGGKLTIFDIRGKDEDAMQVMTHNGPKAQKHAWLNPNTLISSGFNRQAKREYAIWDMRSFKEPVARGELG